MLRLSLRRVCVTLFTLLLLLGGAAHPILWGPGSSGEGIAHAATIPVSLTTSKGCGSGATVHNGGALSIFFSVGQTSDVRLVNVKPNETRVLVDNFTAHAGVVYRIDSFGGLPFGMRTLKLDAVAGSHSGHIECTFSVVSDSPPLISQLETDKGCGDGAVYRVDDEVKIFFKVAETADVRIVEIHADGTEVVTDTFEAVGGTMYTVTGTVAPPLGPHVYKMTATRDSRTEERECHFRVIAKTPALIATFQTDRGCGSGAVYKEGEGISYFVKVSENATVKIINVRPDGEQLLAHFFAIAGTLYQFNRTVGEPLGDRTLQITADTGTRTEYKECFYKVISSGPPDNSIVITLATTRGCGAGVTYRPQESVAFDFTVSQDAFIRVRIQGTNYSQELVKQYPVTKGMRYRFIVDVGEPVGNRTIIIDAIAGAKGGHAECHFVVAS